MWRRFGATRGAEFSSFELMEDFRKLEVYHLARAYSKAVWLATRQFPAYQKPRLAAQLDDSSESIGANIAEGCGRKNWTHSNVEFIRFLHFAYGSASETQHRVCGAFDKELIPQAVYSDLETQVDTLNAKLTRLIQHLERNDRGRVSPRKAANRRERRKPPS